MIQDIPGSPEESHKMIKETGEEFMKAMTGRRCSGRPRKEGAVTGLLLECRGRWGAAGWGLSIVKMDE